MAVDLYTEPDPIDPDTLANLGPLAPLAGSWEGRGEDLHPVAEGEEKEPYLERIDFEPIDPQPNGPQLLYGLRYHVFVTKVGETETFHDQVGYWLWEPATGGLWQTLAIPRAQVALAAGRARPGDRTFTVKAELGSPTAGIASGPFLHENFRTESYACTFTLNADGTLSYEQDTVLRIAGRSEPFHHTDRNVLRKVAGPVKNPALR
ncbi:MAG: heme-binding beta-barrel domain-containing protein [Anaeromyxobacter sp.]